MATLKVSSAKQLSIAFKTMGDGQLNRAERQIALAQKMIQEVREMRHRAAEMRKSLTRGGAFIAFGGP